MVSRSRKQETRGKGRRRGNSHINGIIAVKSSRSHPIVQKERKVEEKEKIIEAYAKTTDQEI